MQYFDNNETFKFKSDLGIFSKDKIDEGSKVLVETYIK